MSQKDDQENSLEAALIDSIAAREIRGIANDSVELTLDALLSDGLLERIPIVGWIGRFCRAGVDIRHLLFARKVAAFLSELSDVSDAERQKFVEQLSRDSGTRARAGAALLLLLERLDDIDKPKILGHIYRARLEGRITHEELRRYCMVLDRAHLPDLIDLGHLPPGGRVDGVSAPHLHSLGLVTITGEDYGMLDGIGADTWYVLNEFGRDFLVVSSLLTP